jgi:hypothetical protein
MSGELVPVANAPVGGFAVRQARAAAKARTATLGAIDRQCPVGWR